jgi:hypothetical protein
MQLHTNTQLKWVVLFFKLYLPFSQMIEA